MFCRNCGKELIKGGTFCAFCGTSASDDSATAFCSEVNALPKYCKSCSNATLKDRNFCMQCGMAASGAPTVVNNIKPAHAANNPSADVKAEKAPETQPKHKKTLRIGLGVGVGAAVLVLIIILSVTLGSKNFTFDSDFPWGASEKEIVSKYGQYSSKVSTEQTLLDLGYRNVRFHNKDAYMEFHFDSYGKMNRVSFYIDMDSYYSLDKALSGDFDYHSTDDNNKVYFLYNDTVMELHCSYEYRAARVEIYKAD